MPKKQVSVDIESSGYDVMQALGRIASAVKQALADGFQPGQDLPILVTEAVAELPKVMVGLSGIPADLAEDKLAFLKGVNIGTYDLAEGLLK